MILKSSGIGQEVGGATSATSAHGIPLFRAWRRGLFVCVVMVAVLFCFSMVSSPHRVILSVFNPRVSASLFPSTPNSSLLQDYQSVPKGFLVHSPGCSIPDFDPLHRTIKKFISTPKPIKCSQPEAFTSARGSTLFVDWNKLRRIFPYILDIYRNLHPTTTSTTTTATTTTTKKPPITTTTTTKKLHTTTNATSKTTIKKLPSTTTTTTTTPTPSPRVITSAEKSKSRSAAFSSSRSTPSSGKRRRRRSANTKKFVPEDVTCCYQGIYRLEQERKKAGGSADHRYRINKTCKLITETRTEVEEDAALVTCFLGSTTVYKNVHYFFRKKIVSPDFDNTPSSQLSSDDTASSPTPRWSMPRMLRVEEPDKLSVIIMGTDATSRLNLLRHNPKTYHYLTEDLGAVDMKGYNKIGDNTFPNLVAMLGGYTQAEVDNGTCMTKSRHYDDCHWAWRDFKKNDYVTAYMEVVHDYALEFARTFVDTPFFGFFWSASLTHDDHNLVHLADDIHLEYLMEMKRMGALNNTALFFVSDHGMRWGGLRNTYIGMMEERLPYVIVYLPPWFREKYHQAYANVLGNAHRLTSNFDVYETLMDIASGRYADPDYITSEPSRTRRGTSLFRIIHWNRTCSEASIPSHYCTCQDTQEVTKQDPIMVPAASALLDFLNAQLRPYQQCEQFSKVSVLSARVSLPNKEVKPKQEKTEMKMYLLRASLIPGDVMVEATMQYTKHDGSIKVLDSVSRVNKYGSTSACITHDKLRKYCYCKDLKEAERIFNERMANKIHDQDNKERE